MTGITAEKINTALGLIDRFENGEQPLAPQDAEQLVKRIFDACGYDVTQSGFFGGDQEARRTTVYNRSAVAHWPSRAALLAAPPPAVGTTDNARSYDPPKQSGRPDAPKDP